LSQYFRRFSEMQTHYQDDVNLLKTNIAKELGLTLKA